MKLFGITISTPRKLVRDNIPNAIQNTGGYCIVRQLEGKAFRKALAKKLVEEAREVAACKTSVEAAVEIADLQSVLEAYRIAMRVPIQDIAAARELKDLKTGLFSKGYKLLFLFRPFKLALTRPTK